jgi:hypothetical protein
MAGAYYLCQVPHNRRNDLAREGMSTGDSRLIGRVRFLRAGLVTPLPGGLGIGPAGTMTGATFKGSNMVLGNCSILPPTAPGLF